jgi:hypothetical protein
MLKTLRTYIIDRESRKSESCNSHLYIVIAFLALCTIAGVSISAEGQQPPSQRVPVAVAEKLAAARNVFVVPSRSKSSNYDSSREGMDDSSYFRNQLVEALEIGRRYQLVPMAEGADLVFDVSIHGDELRVNVRDAKAQSVLWSFHRKSHKAILLMNKENNFVQAIASLLDDIRQATGQRAGMTPFPPATSTAPPAQAAVLPKVFISNIGAGEDDREPVLFGSYTGGPGQGYNKFHAAVQSSGLYQLVTAPAQADLIFEVRYSNAWRNVIWPPNRPGDHEHHPENDNYLYYPQMQLVVWLRQTREVLTAVTAHIEGAVRRSTQDGNFAISIQVLLNEAAASIGAPAPKSSVASAALPVPHTVPEAPVPSQIASARKVFIAKPGEGRVYPTEAAMFLYDEVHAAVQSQGRYELAAKATDADLIVEPSVADGLLRLSLVDPETSVVLWAFNLRDDETALRPKYGNKTIHNAAGHLMDSFHGLDLRAKAAALPPSQSAKAYEGQSSH